VRSQVSGGKIGHCNLRRALQWEPFAMLGAFTFRPSPQSEAGRSEPEISFHVDAAMIGTRHRKKIFARMIAVVGIAGSVHSSRDLDERSSHPATILHALGATFVSRVAFVASNRDAKDSASNAAVRPCICFPPPRVARLLPIFKLANASFWSGRWVVR